MGVLFALLASASWGVGDFLGGLRSRAMPALAIMAASQPVGLLLLGIAVAARAEAPPGPEVAWAVLAAVFGTIGLAAFYRGMAVGAISIVAPIAGASAVIPVVAGLIGGDNPSLTQEIGFVCAIVGVSLASWEGGGRAVAAGVGLAAVALLSFGGYFIAVDQASSSDFLWPAFIFRCTSTTLVWSALLARRERLSVPKGFCPSLVAIGILDTGGNTLFAAAAGRGAVSVVSVLASLYPVITVGLAQGRLGERFRPLQGAGAALTIAGAALVSAG